MNDDLPLAAEFPPATREQWLKLVQGVLKGAPFEKKLVARTYDGLAIEPLYARAAAAQPVAARAPGAAWTILQRVDHPDPAAANALALHDLENGATGLSLVFAGSIGAYGYGLDASEATIARALDSVRSRRRHRARPRSQPADQGCRAAARRPGQAARRRAGRDRHPFRLRSDRSGRGGRRQSPALARARADLQRGDLRPRGPGFSRAVCGRRTAG